MTVEGRLFGHLMLRLLCWWRLSAGGGKRRSLPSRPEYSGPRA